MLNNTSANRNHENLFFSTENETVIPEKSNQNVGTFIYFSKVIYDWSAFFLTTPVRLHYDRDREVFLVKKCNEIQRMAHILIVISYTFSAVFSFFQTSSALLQNTGNIVLYFDVLNKLAVNSGIYIHMYVHWFRLDLVESYIDAIQTSPIIKYCRTPIWIPISVTIFFCSLILHLSCTWLVLIFGFEFTSLEGFHNSLQIAARELFWWDRNKAVEPSLPACIVAFFGKLSDSYIVHVPLDAFCLMQLYCIYFIVKDFLGTLLEEGIDSDEGLKMIYEYISLMKKANRYLGLYVVQFLGMTITYHSIHLFDMLSSTTILWKISTYAYVGFVVNFFFLVTLIFVETKKMKQWLWKDQNYMKIPFPELITLLYDSQTFNYKFGIRIGKFYTMTSDFCGGILAQMISYSMLVKLSG
ncbi:unnamed protein product [Allacma fusca]|uniref:Uncharacterized protein n=1 Tax=Allacma fusca TaxID=39272 RepID=A0A8J2JI59_9HEXA|nr:unnamed protein product [Allacma fusca]